MDYQESQIPGDHGVETVCDSTTDTAGDRGTEISVDHGVPTEADSSTVTADKTLPVNSLQRKHMSKSQDEPHELEDQFILRLPPEQASTVRKMLHSRRVAMKDKLKIDLSSDERHAVVQVEDVSLSAKVVDLPCVIGSLKTLDKKIFYKTADISQMLVCSAGGDRHSSPQEPVTSTDLNVTENNERQTEKKYVWKHGITPPLKNVRKRRFRKTKKKLPDANEIEEISLAEHFESPDVEKEVKRLLCSDAEAISARWEVIADDGTKETESQEFIPGLPISPEMSGYKQGHNSSEYDMFPEMFNDSSSKNYEKEDEEDDDKHDQEENDSDEEDEDDDEKEEEEEDDYEEALDRELQAKFSEYNQYATKECARSIVMEIQKQIHYKEKKLQGIQCKAQRQKNIIMKVKNLTLKNHLQSALEQLKLQEKQKCEQLIFLQKQLKHFLKK